MQIYFLYKKLLEKPIPVEPIRIYWRYGTMQIIKSFRSGLTLIDKLVTKNGKTFHQHFWTRLNSPITAKPTKSPSSDRFIDSELTKFTTYRSHSDTLNTLTKLGITWTKHPDPDKNYKSAIDSARRAIRQGRDINTEALKLTNPVQEDLNRSKALYLSTKFQSRFLNRKDLIAALIQLGIPVYINDDLSELLLNEASQGADLSKEYDFLKKTGKLSKESIERFKRQIKEIEDAFNTSLSKILDTLEIPYEKGNPLDAAIAEMSKGGSLYLQYENEVSKLANYLGATKYGKLHRALTRLPVQFTPVKDLWIKHEDLVRINQESSGNFYDVTANRIYLPNKAIDNYQLFLAGAQAIDHQLSQEDFNQCSLEYNQGELIEAVNKDVKVIDKLPFKLKSKVIQTAKSEEGYKNVFAAITAEILSGNMVGIRDLVKYMPNTIKVYLDVVKYMQSAMPKESPPTEVYSIDGLYSNAQTDIDNSTTQTATNNSVVQTVTATNTDIVIDNPNQSATQTVPTQEDTDSSNTQTATDRSNTQTATDSSTTQTATDSSTTQTATDSSNTQTATDRATDSTALNQLTQTDEIDIFVPKIKRDYKSKICKFLGKDNYNKVIDIVDNLPDEFKVLRLIWSRYEKDIKITARSKNGCYFSPDNGTINLPGKSYINELSQDTSYAKAWSVLFHEWTHLVDHHKGLGVNYCILYKHGAFQQTIKEDVNNLLSQFGLDNYAQQSLDSYNSNLLSLKEALLEEDPVEYASLADLISGATDGNINLDHRVVHSKDYWTSERDLLAMEALAGITEDIMSGNYKSIEKIKKYLPNTFREYKSVIHHIITDDDPPITHFDQHKYLVNTFIEHFGTNYNKMFDTLEKIGVKFSRFNGNTNISLSNAVQALNRAVSNGLNPIQKLRELE